MIVSLIAAYALDSLHRKVIGFNNKIPWHSKTDLRRFKEYTSKYPVVMGRKTHESIGRLLPDRENIIITSQTDLNIPGAHIFQNLDKALSFARDLSSEVFIIGGQNIYEQTIERADRLYLTKILISGVRGDTFFPRYNPGDYKEIYKEVAEGEVFSIFQRFRRIYSLPLDPPAISDEYMEGDGEVHYSPDVEDGS